MPNVKQEGMSGRMSASSNADFLKNVTDSTKPDDWISPDTTTCELLYGWWMLLNAADYYYYSFVSQAFSN